MSFCNSARNRRRILRWTAIVFFSALTVGAGVLWWRTTHVDRHGWLPKPPMVIGVPGGFFQATGMEDGLHCLCMRDTNRRGFSIQFERQTYLGNSGYHYDDQHTFGGFTFVLLTSTIHDYDVIQSQYAAIVFPYWFLVSASVFLLLCSLGLVRVILLMWTRRAPASLPGIENGAE